MFMVINAFLLIRNERRRTTDKCSAKTTTTKHQYMFEDILNHNRYPENSINQTKHPQNHQKDSGPLNTEWPYLKIQYISKRLKITNISEKRAYLYCHAQITHSQKSSLPQNHGTDMHQGKRYRFFYSYVYLIIYLLYFTLCI